MSPTAVELNTALVDTVARSQGRLNAVLDEIGWCDALPPWPQTILAAPGDVYLLQAHALAVLYALAHTACPCHRDGRGKPTIDIISRWRAVVDHAISFAVLCPAGRTEDLHRYCAYYRAAEAAFHRQVDLLLGT
ncbi:hypothetical protein MXD61_04525 [Frankia sp. AgPm24]|uniref:hypothetical protein n=1 Tax=Frankia sp. AgPm24 TaxID=631128 RepID=UPI00200CA4CA|nr:hypothetical protein [Frankia sp. AgPm24]MCK9921175.1 hypothetical protein [Frankia sp. AgPm24]